MRLEKDLPLNIVGSTVFGRYPDVSVEQTFNMIISDDWLVPFGGYRIVGLDGQFGTVGRGIYSSIHANIMLFVIDNIIYRIQGEVVAETPNVEIVATIPTYVGNVYIAENEKKEIAICDLLNIYIYDYDNNTFTKAYNDANNPEAGLNFQPTYVSYQNGYFITGAKGKPIWYLNDLVTSAYFPQDSQHVGGFQTKGDAVQAMIPVPGKSNLLYVMGSIVTEPWYNLGYQLFPYQKNTFENIDYGTVNASSIDYNDKMVVWIAQNNKSGPSLMVSDGGNATRISNDGIDFKLAQLTNPTESYVSLFRQDGHNLALFTFFNPADNLSFVYDFNTNKFFSVSDSHMNIHIAKKIVAYRNSYYFISLTDGNLYEMNTRYSTYAGVDIPRVRVCATLRTPDNTRFAIPHVNFTVEQGDDGDISCVDMSMSVDGGYSFSSVKRLYMNPRAQRLNRLDSWQWGTSNEFTFQFRFYGKGRFLCSNGLARMYQ